jgi:hypothetical protein
MGSPCPPAATGGPPPGSAHSRRPWRGAMTCSVTRSGVFRVVSVFPGPFTPPGRSCCGWWTVHCSRCRGPTPTAGPVRDAGNAARLRRQAARRSQGMPRRAGGAGLLAGAGELAAVRWLDAEDATMQQALTWTLQTTQLSRCGWRPRWPPGASARPLGRRERGVARHRGARRAGQQRVVHRLVLTWPAGHLYIYRRLRRRAEFLHRCP